MGAVVPPLPDHRQHKLRKKAFPWLAVALAKAAMPLAAVKKPPLLTQPLVLDIAHCRSRESRRK
jgi:hypothetical protein